MKKKQQLSQKLYFTMSQSLSTSTYGDGTGTFTYVIIPADPQQPCTEATVSFANFEEKVSSSGHTSTTQALFSPLPPFR